MVQTNRIPSSNKTEEFLFLNFTRVFDKKSKSNIAHELLEGFVGEQILSQVKFMKSLSTKLCDLDQQIQRIQGVLFRINPREAGENIFPGQGKVTEPRGDALLVKNCRKVSEYVINWDRVWNKSCYHLLPIVGPTMGSRFLDLETRRILRSSHKVRCSMRPSLTFVTDIYGKFWRYTLGVGFKRVKVDRPQSLGFKVWAPVIQKFNKRLFKEDKAVPPRATLLNLVAQQEENLHSLYDVRELGGGSFASGITRLVTSALKSVGEAGSELIDSIASGLEGGVGSVGNATATVITASGIDKVFESIGGTPNLVLFGLWVIGMFCLCHLKKELADMKTLLKCQPRTAVRQEGASLRV